MSIPINRIKIIEEDLTGIKPTAQDITDIVYIPGFAQTNTNIYVLTSGSPASTLNGTSHTPDKSINYILKDGEYPQWCSNTSDKKTWKFVNGSWVLQSEYIEPLPENVPVFCNSIKSFEHYFGSIPYKFTSNMSIDDVVEITQGSYDKSYIYAKELISAGIPVYYENVTESRLGSNVKPAPSLEYFYSVLPDCFDNIANNKNEYNIKYITSGAYPVFGTTNNIEKLMMIAAFTRGDTVALIDAPNIPSEPLTGEGSVYSRINENITNGDNGDSEIKGLYTYVTRDSDDNIVAVYDYGSYGAMIYPWAMYNCQSAPFGENAQIMPGSFAYLRALSTSIRNYANWLPIAGVVRGQVPAIKYLNTVKPLTNHIADSYQDKDEGNINAITNIADYGLTIWGNRTLKNNSYNFGAQPGLTATSFLNLRNLLSDVKKQVYRTAKSLLFQPNTNTLWVNFKSGVNQILDKMVTGGGIKSYKIIRGESDEQTKVVAIIKIVPVYAVEEFEVTVQISNSDEVTVE